MLHKRISPSWKLKALKLDLKKLNEELFGNVDRKKRILLEELRVFDVIEKERALGVEEKIKKAEVVIELERSTLMEEVSWRQTQKIIAWTYYAAQRAAGGAFNRKLVDLSKTTSLAFISRINLNKMIELRIRGYKASLLSWNSARTHQDAQ
jgi:hypothetical protein